MHVTRLFCPPLKWEKGGGGMRGNSARECKTSLISPKNSTPESNPSLSQTRQPPRAAADGAASTKVDARRNAPTARFPIASPFPGGTPARRDVNRQPRSGRGNVHEGGRPAERLHGAMSIACPSPGGTPARRDVNRQPRSGRGSVHEGGRPTKRPHGAMSIASPFPHRGGFFGKPLHAISRFIHQNAQTPPSPRVGEGGRGDEGQQRTGMQKITDLSQEIYP